MNPTSKLDPQDLQQQDPFVTDANEEKLNPEAGPLERLFSTLTEIRSEMLALEGISPGLICCRNSKKNESHGNQGYNS